MRSRAARQLCDALLEAAADIRRAFPDIEKFRREQSIHDKMDRYQREFAHRLRRAASWASKTGQLHAEHGVALSLEFKDGVKLLEKFISKFEGR
jgi:hypothetical protein